MKKLIKDRKFAICAIRREEKNRSLIFYYELRPIWWRIAGAGIKWEGELDNVTNNPKENARVSRTSLILWPAHQNDAGAVRKLLEEDRSLVQAKDYDNRTPLHVDSLHGWIDVAKRLLGYGADVNAQDRWKNTPLADAEGAKKQNIIELILSQRQH